MIFPVRLRSRLPLLLPAVGKREASGGSVFRVGGYPTEDRGSQHAASCHQQTGEWDALFAPFIKVTLGCDLLIVCVIVISGGKPAASGAGGEGRE